MYEVYVLIERKKSSANRLVSVLLLALAISIMAVALFLGSLSFVIFAIVCGVLWYFVTFRMFKEYEYSFFDGECRFARIMNKSRRKRLKVLSMDDVMQIAPAGERSVYKYENDSSVKVIDYTSGDKSVPYYEMIVKGANGIEMIKFEPDEEYLNAVCVKSAQKVIRR